MRLGKSKNLHERFILKENCTNCDYLGKGFGGAKGDRTPDLLHAMQALSQLSYGPNTDDNTNQKKTNKKIKFKKLNVFSFRLHLYLHQ